MEYIFCAGNLTLPTTLRTWQLSDATYWLQHWDWFVSQDYAFLYRQVGENGWHRHLRRNGRGRTYHLKYLALNPMPAGDLLRATVTSTSTAWTLRSTSLQFVVTDPSQEATLRSLDAIPYRKHEIRWFMNHPRSSKSRTVQLCQHLLDGTAIQFSDGSYFLADYQVGACAWILATPDGKEWIEGGGLVPGSPEDQSAYRRKLAGQVGAVSFVDSIPWPCGSRGDTANYILLRTFCPQASWEITWYHSV